MQSIQEMVASLGGMAQKQELVTLGASDRDLTLAVKRKSVLRARQGWYTTGHTNEPAVRAVRVGGRLTGLSALIELGAWIYGTPPLHVSMRENSSRMRSQWDRRKSLPRRGRSVRLHWDDGEVASRGTSTSVGLEDALLRVILDENLVTAVAVIDWAIHSGRLDRIGLEILVLRLPAGLRGIVGWVDFNCGSLLESVGRTRFRMHGLAVISQVRVGTLKSIDLVIENTVAIEADGKKHHNDTFEADRVKDLEISLAGFHAMRPSASIIFTQWPRLLRAVDIALAARGVAASRHPVNLPARGRRGSVSSRRGRKSSARQRLSHVGNSGQHESVAPKVGSTQGRSARARTDSPESPTQAAPPVLPDGKR